MSVARSDAKNKPVVARAVAEVINAGNLDAVDELYAPAIAAAVKSWVAPFRNRLITTWWALEDNEARLRQLGLRETSC